MSAAVDDIGGFTSGASEISNNSQKVNMERLFTYGSLNPQHSPAELEEVLQRFVFVANATVRGRLFQLQEYPGLVLDAAAEPVAGRLFDVPEDSWERLDDYEGYDPAVQESSLFVRVKALVRRSDGADEEAWIYVYNRHV